MERRIPLLSPLADALEALVVGRFRGYYRWIVGGLAALMVLLLAADLVLLVVDRGGVEAGRYATVLEATAVAIALFVLAGVVQLVVVARAVDRTGETVAAAAEELADGAEEVVEAAETVEEAAADLPAEEPPVETAREHAETAQERGEQAREAAEQARERLAGDREPSDEER